MDESNGDNTSGVLCSIKILKKMKGKLYTSLARPITILYGSKCWAVGKKIGQRCE